MNSTEIHNGLDKKGIRDFLSMSLVNTFEEECNNKKETVPYGKSTTDNIMIWAIKDCENDIEYHKKRLDLLYQKQGAINLIKSNGWKEFDVSDYTINNTNKRMWMNFIGTDEEHEEFINNLTK